MIAPEVVLPRACPGGYAAHVEAMRRRPRGEPFAPAAVAFADAVAKAILGDRGLRDFPEVMVLGHWLRGAHLTELAREAPASGPGALVRGRGVALHFAPGNVDTMFAYSWFLAALMGNANVLRLSSTPSAQVDALLAIVGALLEEDRFAEVAADTLVLRYPHDAALSEWLSLRCDLRILWGSDESVQALRAIALAPLAVELAFPDRFSLAALSARAVSAADPAAFTQLVHAFFKDAYGFSQQACSSPRLVAWIGGEAEVAAAQARFWPALEAHWRERGAPAEAALASGRLVAAMRLAGAGVVDHSPLAADGGPQRARLAGPGGEFREVHCGGGLFLEASHATLAALGTHLVDRDQTLTVFGFPREALAALARAVPGRALDRIVAVGRALEFSPRWDGHDLPRSMCRVVELEP